MLELQSYTVTIMSSVNRNISSVSLRWVAMLMTSFSCFTNCGGGAKPLTVCKPQLRLLFIFTTTALYACVLRAE